MNTLLAQLPIVDAQDTAEKILERLNAVPAFLELVPTPARVMVASLMAERKNSSRPTVAAKLYEGNFMEPGLCWYEDISGSGNCLVRKPAIDDALPTIIGIPMVDKRHRTPRPDQFRQEADGVVVSGWYNSADGHYYSRFLVWDPVLQADCDEGAESGKYALSCAYDPIDATETGGLWHMIPYEGEITKLKFTHMAVVNVPRYDSQITRLNSQGGSPMLKIPAWLKGEKKEIDPNATVKVGDKDVKISELVERYNAAPAPIEITHETEIEIGDKRVSVGELIAGHVERTNAAAIAKKAEEEAAAKKEEERIATERKNAADAQALKEKQEKEQKEAEERERKNAADEAARIAALRNANTQGVPTEIKTMEERVAAGKAMFGSKK